MTLGKNSIGSEKGATRDKLGAPLRVSPAARSRRSQPSWKRLTKIRKNSVLLSRKWTAPAPAGYVGSAIS